MTAKRWPLRESYFWERAPFFRVLVPLVVGIGACIGLRHSVINPSISPEWEDLFSVWALLSGVMLSFFIYGWLVIMRKKRDKVRDVVAFVCFNVFMFCVGGVLVWVNDVRNDSDWFGKSVGTGGAYVARVVEVPAEKENSDKLTVDVLGVLKDGRVNGVGGKGFVYVYKDDVVMGFHKGDTVLLKDKWLPVKNAGNPFEFDYAGYCARNNLYYQQFVEKGDVQLYHAGNGKDAGMSEQAHDWCMEQLDIYLPDKTTKGLIQAMLLGDEVNLDEHLRQAYAETGIVHVIAISGGNVAIFFIVISWALWWMRHKKYQWVKYLVALPLVWFYVVMAGAQPSAVRAAIMFTVLAGGFILQKNYSSLNGLFATAVLLLCAQPMWLFSLGFQLSFVAVLSLIVFYEPVYRLLYVPNKVVSAIWKTIAASVAAELLTAPLVIYYFHLLPVVFVVANVAAYLFMGVVLVLGMLIVVFSFVPVVAKGIGIVTTWIVMVFDKMIYTMQHWNPDVMGYLRLSMVELLCVYFIIGGIALFLLKKNNRGLFIGMGGVCLLLLSFCRNEWVNLRQERLVVYNMSKVNETDVVRGKEHRTLFSVSEVADDKRGYTLKPAYTEWRSYDTADTKGDCEALMVGNKKVLLLNHVKNYKGDFPVDELVVNYPVTVKDMQGLIAVFNPEKIILSNAVKRKEQEGCLRIAEDGNIHAVGRNGAYILEGFQQ